MPWQVGCLCAAPRLITWATSGSRFDSGHVHFFLDLSPFVTDIIGMNDNEIRTIYQIPEANLETLRHEIAKLNRRASKLGVVPVTLTETGAVQVIEKKDDVTGLVVKTSKIIEIELVGQTPKFAGWTLAATLEHTPEGNIIRKVPSCTVDLMPFKQCTPKCQHCNLQRNRKDTYLVAHDDGRTLQVGHDCIRDFLGHASPQGLAAMAELLFSAGELCSMGEDCDFEGGGSRGKEYVYARTFMAYCARAIRQYGYVSRKAEQEAEMEGTYRASTKSTVMSWMFPPPDAECRRKMREKHCLDGEAWPTPSVEDVAKADAAREYAVSVLETKSDLTEFENNLLICSKLESLEFRTCGIAAYVVEYFRRATEKDAEQKQANNTHFGEIGKRYKKVSLTYLGCASFDSQWGTCFIHRLENEAGQRLVWKTGTELGYADGFKFVAAFTVKEHGEFKGWNQTKISRVVESV